MIKMLFTSRFALSQLALLIFFIIFSLFLPKSGSAMVKGVCSNCHTMHNSQNGTGVARGGSGVGWGSGGLEGGTTLNQGPNNQLLVTTCVGCHTSTTNATIYDPGGLNIPIVYNTVTPNNPLAGGNFYWVAQGSDAKGHNVNGIATQDLMLTKAKGAPGLNPSGCAGSCHYTLADDPSTENSSRGGCQGCHVFTYHHEDNGVYRFLKGHGTGASMPFSTARKNITDYPDYVLGDEDNDWEDDDWEQETTDRHNWYKGTGDRYNTEGDTLSTYQTVTSFCAGCHSKFHGINNDNKISPYDSSPWIRHPADLLLPDEREYSGYDPSDDAKYSAEAPVGWINPSTPVRSEAVVMCLSCHRPHGSPYPDMLRWDYNTMITGGTSTDTGCFTCHTSKNVAP